jgi:hypothetical protein
MRFNPDEYAMVEERLAELHAKYEDARVETICHTAGVGGKWLFEARIYLSAGDQANGLFKATGWASESEEGAQANWAAELAETSSIGRSLANLGMTGNRKKRASYEEMLKVERVTRNWLEEASKMTDIESLRLLWAEASAAKVSENILSKIKELASERQDSGSKRAGAKGSVHTSAKSKPVESGEPL